MGKQTIKQQARRAGAALAEMTGVEGLTKCEAVNWCGE